MNERSLSLRKNGYLVVKNFLSHKNADSMLDSLKYPFNIMIKKHCLERESFNESIVLLFNNHYKSFLGATRQLHNNIDIHELGSGKLMKSLLNSVGLNSPYFCSIPMVVFNCSLLAREEYQHKTPIHQDWRSMQGSTDSLVAWLPLVEVNKKNGAIEILPSSHTKGLLKTVEDKWYRKIPDELVDLNKFVTINLSKGDLLLFSSTLVHRSGFNSTKNMRWACQFRYNNLDESSFIDREFFNPYTNKPSSDLKHNYPGFDI